MERLWIIVLHRGIAASYLILAVILVRFLLKKAPKSMICLLWMVVGFRLLSPFHMETPFSLLPKQAESLGFASYEKNPLPNASDTQNTIAKQTTNTEQKATDGQSTGRIPNAGTTLNTNTSSKANVAQNIYSLLTKHVKANDKDNALTTKAISVAAWIWAAGIFLLSAYLVFSWLRLKRNVAAAVPSELDGIRFYQCAQIPAPFLFGITVPKIYVPFSICEQELSYVLMHESAHKKRLDHVAKPVGYLLLAIYWFQPLVWAAYLLFCRDIEFACDEQVIKEHGEGCKKAYSQALLSCSVRHRAAAACPVAFGEIGVKERVKNILNYQKPGRLTVFTAATVCMIVIACFATEAKSSHIPQTDGNMAVEKNTSTKNSKKKLRTIRSCVTKWAEAFCDRDAKTINQMLDSAGRKQLRDANMLDGNHSFGWSSPWPWSTGTMDSSPNYKILSVDETSAQILYYAWTSDPHVTVWYESLSYQYDEKMKQISVRTVTSETLDSIHTSSQFFTAYPNGEIDGTQMDYYQGNGTGNALNRNARTQDKEGVLFQPDTAAIFLLNIEDDPAAVKVKTEKQNGQTIVTFTFLEDDSSARVKMIQPYGKHSIWLPQTAPDSTDMKK